MNATSTLVEPGTVKLERLLPGWISKLFVLALLGFAATDFVITMTLSAADAAEHMVENPYLKQAVGHGQLWVTLVLLALLAGVFLRGFGEAIGLAVAVGVPYMLLNLVVVVRAALEIAHHPALLSHWSAALAPGGDCPVAFNAGNNGKISVRNREGGGAEFLVTVPIADSGGIGAPGP